MAKPKQPAAPQEPVEEAVILPPEMAPGELPLPEEVSPHSEPLAEPMSDAPAEADPMVESDPVEEIASEPELEPAATPEPLPREIERELAQPRGGFVPLVLGGVIAAAVGFGAARYLVPEGWPFGPQVSQIEALSHQLDAQSAGLSSMKADLATLQAKLVAVQSKAAASAEVGAALDAAKSDLGDRIVAVQKALTTRSEALQQALAALDARVGVAGAAAATGADVTPGDSAALGQLQSVMEQQKAQTDALAEQIKTLGEQTNARIDDAEKQAQALKADAEAVAKAALARATLTRVQTAVETGGGFAPALADLSAQGVTLPDGLTAVAAEGVPTLTDLQTSYPAAARAGLNASIKATMGSSVTARIAAFLRTQTGARSLTPREGSDPDAVLSRAEAELRAGHLGQSLKELAALPEKGQAAMADWIAAANKRLAAQAAVDSVATALNGK